MPLDLRNFATKIDAAIDCPTPEDRHDAYLSMVLPALEVAADELAERWQLTRQMVGGVDGMLLAAETLRELAQLLGEHIRNEE